MVRLQLTLNVQVQIDTTQELVQAEMYGVIFYSSFKSLFKFNIPQNQMKIMIRVDQLQNRLNLIGNKFLLNLIQ